MENLNEQLNRIKLLYNYNLNETYDENKVRQSHKQSITEAAAEALVAARELANVERAVLTRGMEAVVQDIGKVTILDGRGIATSTKSAEEIILAMKEGRIAFAELGRVTKSLLKSPATTAEIKSLAADVITGSKSFEQKYGKLTREQAVSELMNGPGKYTKGEAETLMDSFKAKKGRMEPPKPKEGPKPEGPVTQQNVTQNVTVVIEKEGFRIAEEYGPHMDDMAKKKGFNDAEDWFRNDMEGFTKEYESVTCGFGIMEGRRRCGIGRRILNWAKKIITWKAIVGILKITGIGLTLWAVYSLFTSKGWKVKDDDKIDDDDVKIDDDDKGGGDKGVLIDVDGNKYIECTPPYYKGCVAKKGNDDIRKAQDCLGVTPNGFFNKETEDALFKKINKKSFSPSDMPSICATSYGASRFSY
jgi:hypothetical protein